MAMPNFHLRGLPPDLYEALRRRSAEKGRSMNAEIVSIVREALERDRERRRLKRDLARLRRRVRLPADAPTPEQIIREARDERSRRP